MLEDKRLGAYHHGGARGKSWLLGCLVLLSERDDGPLLLLSFLLSSSPPHRLEYLRFFQGHSSSHSLLLPPHIAELFKVLDRSERVVLYEMLPALDAA